MSADLRQPHLLYQRALLGLLRGEEPGRRLEELGQLAARLREHAQTEAAQEFWRLVIDVVDDARQSDGVPAAGTLRLLGAVERQVKTWIREGEGCFEEGEARTLARKLGEVTTRISEANDYAQPLDTESTPAVGDSVSTDAGDSREPADVAALSATIRNLAGHPAWSNESFQTTATADAGTKSNCSDVDRVRAIKEAEAVAQPDGVSRPVTPDDEGVESENTAALDTERPEPSTPAAVKKRPGALLDSEPELRMSDRVPFSNTMPRLKWVGRQSCLALARPAEFVIEGDGLVDRALLKKMLAPLACVVRNAVYYGIESGHERLEAGKSPVGRITLAFGQGSDGAHLTIETDGLAVDPDRIRRKAEELGLLDHGQKINRDDLLVLLAAEGFSTAHVATQTAGYGVGLDNAVRQLEGAGCSLILSQAGQSGLRFRVSFPS